MSDLLYFSYRRGSPFSSFNFLTYCLAPLLSLLKFISGSCPSTLKSISSNRYYNPLQNLNKSSSPLLSRIIKGDNTRGRFDMFCYAFATMKGNEQFGHSVIRKLQESYPNWKMNVKFDDKRKFQNNRPYQPPQYPPAQHPFPPFNHHPMHRQFNPYPPNSNHPSESLPSEKILGEKPCNILVRELWLGGIP